MMLKLVEQTRRRAFALTDERLIPGMSAVGIAVPPSDKQPVAALSVAAISSRLALDRIETVVQLLAEECAALHQRLLCATAELTAASFRRVIRLSGSALRSARESFGYQRQ